MKLLLISHGDFAAGITSTLRNQAALPFLGRENTFLISGMNLSLLLQLAMESEVTEEGIREMIATAKEDMAFINDMSLGKMDEDDE